MLGKIISAAIIMLIGTPAMAAVPTLSGKYVYTWSESCVSTGGTSVAHETGIATFNAATKMVSMSGYTAKGSPPTLQSFSGSGSYSNTATTLTLAGTTYRAFYGKVVGGVATYVSYIAVVPGSGGAKCADQAWLSLQ